MSLVSIFQLTLIANTPPNPLGVSLVIAGCAAFGLLLFEVIGAVQRGRYPDTHYDLSQRFEQYASFMAQFSRGGWRRYVRYTLLTVVVLALLASAIIAAVGY